MFKQWIRDNKELKLHRKMIYSEYHSKSSRINRMDHFVAYRFNQSLECYLDAFYEESILFSGMALEEHLANVYEFHTRNSPSKKYKIKNEVIELEKMDLEKYIIWAKRHKILKEFAEEYKILDAIVFIRTYIVQSHRVIISTLQKRFPDRNFDYILPKESSDPDWFQNVYYLAMGDIPGMKHSTTMWIFSHDAPVKILKLVYNIIEKTTPPDKNLLQSRCASIRETARFGLRKPRESLEP